MNFLIAGILFDSRRKQNDYSHVVDALRYVQLLLSHDKVVWPYWYDCFGRIRQAQLINVPVVDPGTVQITHWQNAIARNHDQWT